jgi:SAM-dependent methyltransferase
VSRERSSQLDNLEFFETDEKCILRSHPAVDSWRLLAMPQDPVVPETPGVVIGNTTPKYTARNPAIRKLTQRWVANLEGTFERVAGDPEGTPKRALEVGCGEGVIADKLLRRWAEVVALDLPDAGLRAEWRHYRGPRFLHGDAHALPFEDKQFDLVVAVEVLEHLADPVQGLREIARVGSRHVVLSVPREPVFRSCNLVAGRYVRDLGNTPGHLNHWSRSSFARFVATVADVREVTSPFPWTTVWATLPV